MNRAYENIVRYATVKYAMIDVIKYPPKGFEEVVLKNFWLKREIILKDV